MKERTSISSLDQDGSVEGPFVLICGDNRRGQICRPVPKAQEFAVAEYRVSAKASIGRYLLCRDHKSLWPVWLVLYSGVEVRIARRCTRPGIVISTEQSAFNEISGARVEVAQQASARAVGRL